MNVVSAVTSKATKILQILVDEFAESSILGIPRKADRALRGDGVLLLA